MPAPPTRRSFLRGLGVGAAALAALPIAAAPADASPDPDLREDDDRDSAGPRPGQRLGAPRLVWSVTTDRPIACLSFDDGPDPQFTPRILEILDRHGVRANFNVMGHNAERHPSLLREIVAAGHELGNHTWTHLDLAQASSVVTRQQLVEGLARIKAVVDAPVPWFRPPRGAMTGASTRVAAELGHDLLLWSVDRGPAGTSTPDRVATAVGRGTKAGDIVCLHDGIGRGTFSPDRPFARELAARREVEVAALPAIIDQVQQRGLGLVVATDLLAAERARRGVSA